MEVSIEVVPVGQDAVARPGDLLFLHRKGFVNALIRLGEWLRFRSGHWSHCAYVESEFTIIEALAHGVVRSPIHIYRDIEYAIVHTNLSQEDQAQATAFARSCIGEHYGWWEIFPGTALRYLTPGRGLWFGMNGTEICSGLCAQTQVRGWANFPWNPASCTPTELWREYAHLAASSPVNLGPKQIARGP